MSFMMKRVIPPQIIPANTKKYIPCGTESLDTEVDMKQPPPPPLPLPSPSDPFTDTCTGIV